MSFFRLPFVNTHLLVSMLTIVAGDFRYSQGNLHFKNATVQQHYGRTAEFTQIFAKELNQMQSMADLASFLVPKDRRFCSKETFEFLDNSKTAISNTTRWQMSIMSLKEHCARKKRGRLTPAEGLRMQEITRMDRAILEAKKMSCKRRAVLVELPAAPSGSWYYPQCVTAKLCGGCCNNALLECKPISITTVKKQVMIFQVSSATTHKYARTQSVGIEQHKSCQCGCKTLATHCSKMQVYDEESCKCKCKNEYEVETCEHPKEWDPKLCSCMCPESLLCSTGAHINPESCKCTSKKDSNKSTGRKRF